jgi:hypothetical protein
MPSHAIATQGRARETGGMPLPLSLPTPSPRRPGRRAASEPVRAPVDRFGDTPGGSRSCGASQAWCKVLGVRSRSLQSTAKRSTQVSAGSAEFAGFAKAGSHFLRLTPRGEVERSRDGVPLGRADSAGLRRGLRGRLVSCRRRARSRVTSRCSRRAAGARGAGAVAWGRRSRLSGKSFAPIGVILRG